MPASLAMHPVSNISFQPHNVAPNKDTSASHLVPLTISPQSLRRLPPPPPLFSNNHRGASPTIRPHLQAEQGKHLWPSRHQPLARRL